MAPKLVALLVLIIAITAASACIPLPSAATTHPTTSTTPSSISTTSPTASSPTGTGVLSQYQLEYRIFDRYPDYFWCDPDFYPIGREGQEEENSQKQFPDIRANESEFAAIRERLGLLLKNDYTDGEKLDIYREHKKLTRAIQVAASDKGYGYTVRVGEGQGFTIQGDISLAGKINETSRVSSINTCPICLAEGTLIDTPAGPVRVGDLRIGTEVWTVGKPGERIVGKVVQNRSTFVPPNFSIVRVVLADGRSLIASPHHPLTDGRTIADLRVGENLDGGIVTTVESVAYGGRQTWDILPSGPTGFYWAGGILVASTLR